MRGSGIRIDHVAWGRACCQLSEDRVERPERSRFASRDAFTHTALHELGHAPGPRTGRRWSPTAASGGDRRDADRREPARNGGKQAEGARGRAAAPRRATWRAAQSRDTLTEGEHPFLERRISRERPCLILPRDAFGPATGASRCNDPLAGMQFGP